MGYGRGHAMRTSTVLPHLMKKHDVRVYTSLDAYDVLAPQFPTKRIPLFHYRYGKNGRHSLVKTITHNVKPVADLLFQMDGMQALRQEFTEFRPDIVISDSEAWTHRTADAMGIPRISFDHVGIIPFCEPHFPWNLRAVGARDAAVYKAFMGQPDRILISSFYPATPKDARTRVIGPLMRDAVLGVKASKKDHILGYFNKGDDLFRPNVERALQRIDRPVIVYGTSRRGEDGNITYKAPSNDGFVADLASCRAVVGTSGNQLSGEAIHFGKPMLALPEDAFEQRLNAYMIERMNVGMRYNRERVTAEVIEDFLAMAPFFENRMAEHRHDGRAEAEKWLDIFIDELAGGAGPQLVAGTDVAQSR